MSGLCARVKQVAVSRGVTSHNSQVTKKGLSSFI